MGKLGWEAINREETTEVRALTGSLEMWFLSSLFKH